MQARQEYRNNALVRVQGVLAAHDELRPLLDSAAGHQLADAVARVGEAAHQQSTLPRTIAAQKSQQEAWLTALKEKMRAVAEFARVQLRGEPDFAALTCRIHGLRDAQVVRAARSMATAATPYTAVFTAHGFAADAIARLEEAANAVEKAFTDRAQARVAVGGATKNVEQQLRRGRDAVRMLSAAAAGTLSGNPQLQREWEMAKRITAKPGLVRQVSMAADDAASAGTDEVMPVIPVSSASSGPQANAA